ncbi:hypothetical protein EFA46_005345 [Halarchaeum sp. CBA1220]|uniref:hypothetical protein n=1 Tax=Halarchaeum sp. CBA1220 TaxID=1853682 RepID=UPI000F3A86C8|nr:hypothetical protein [Halarchaeum sp. CBA1220]QLC33646.1 hypothetical protein EFA46_005345 [Halarchaeum sp. CBA1220]
MLFEEALARTFSPPSYANPYEAVEDYRRVQRWASRHPESGSSAAASALDLPRGRIRPWMDGATPDAVRAIEAARDLGWFEATPGDDRGRAFTVLSAGVLSGGSISAESYVPRFAVDDERVTDRLEHALDVLGCGSKLVNETVEGRATELEPREHAPLLGRALAALGLPAGAKADGDIVLPEWLAGAPLSVRAEFAELYLLNRAVGRDDKDLVQVQEAKRPLAYRRELAGFFEEVSGGRVTLAGEKAITLSAEASRALGFGRDGLYRRDDG